MSTFAVTAERVQVHPHPNADALELAQVGLYRAVVAKGKFVTGDYAIFIPEQAILPDALIEELGLTGRLAGKNKNRVKAVRLRGELSQGLVCIPELLAGANFKQLHDSKQNLADILGIVKYVPEVPAQMSGEVQAAQNTLPWVDIENIKRYPDLFTGGETVTATEKVHGTCTIYGYNVITEEEEVTSKGLGSKHLALKENENNLYWRMVRKQRLRDFARNVALTYRMKNATGATDGIEVMQVGVFGETYGKGVQDLAYGVDTPQFVVFDISIKDVSGNVTWLDQDTVRAFADEMDMPMVPELYRGPYNYEVLANIAEGKETISGKGANVREGVVVRPLVETRSDVTGDRKIGKIVSAAYLTRKGGTEYE